MYLYTHTYTHLYTHIETHLHRHTHTCLYTRTHTQAYTHTHTDTHRCALPAAPLSHRTSSAAGPPVWVVFRGSSVSPDRRESALEVAVRSTRSQRCGLGVYCECLVGGEAGLMGEPSVVS